MPIITYEEHARRMQDVPGETALTESSADVNASMMTKDSSYNQIAVPNKDKPDDNDETSQRIHVINKTWQSQTDFKYVNVGRHINFKNDFGINTYNLQSAMEKLNENPDMMDKFNSLWQLTEQVMNVKYTETCKVLEAYGIGDGDVDSETDEGQLWRMIQGDAPYTLDLT